MVLQLGGVGKLGTDADLWGVEVQFCSRGTLNRWLLGIRHPRTLNSE